MQDVSTAWQPAVEGTFLPPSGGRLTAAHAQIATDGGSPQGRQLDAQGRIATQILPACNAADPAARSQGATPCWPASAALPQLHQLFQQACEGVASVRSNWR